MNRESVAVTGMSLMTGLGLDLESSWKGLLEAKSPIARFTLFDPEGLASPFGVQLPQGAEEVFKEHVRKRSRDQMTRGTVMALTLAQVAAADAGLAGSGIDSKRIGVVLGATGTGYAPRGTDVDQHRILKNMASSPAAWVSLKGKYGGPSFVVSTACSSGIYALHAAYWLVTTGRCDAVVCGAADSALSYLDVQGFCSLMALSEDVEHMTTASRPFDAKRTGFVLGEGGGMLVVERAETARKRGATIKALFHEPALTSESYNIISPRAEGAGMVETMTLALYNAELAPESISYINAHGTSTKLNDVYETKAIKQVFGRHAADIPVSSTKSMTGHCLSAAAGIEAVVCCKAIEQSLIPPTANLTDPDPECDLDYVPNTPRRTELTNVMCNSFAFGGQNGVCIFSRP